MSRAHRADIVCAIAAGVLGLVDAFAAPTVATHWMPTPVLDPQALPSAIDEFIVSTEAMGTSVIWLHLGGLSIAGVSLLSALALWARWFLRAGLPMPPQ